MGIARAGYKGCCSDCQPFPPLPFLHLLLALLRIYFRGGSALDQGQYWPPPSGMPGVLISIPAAPKRVLSPSAPGGDLSTHHELCVVWIKSTAVFESLTPGVINKFWSLYFTGSSKDDGVH